MRRSCLLLLALAATACTTADRAADSRAAAEPVIAAERAFAARHQQVSVKKAFAEYAAPDGVAITADGVRGVQAFIATWPDRDNAGFIIWWPELAGIARSGDLGFTTGSATFGGDKGYSNYFTIWKKQADGSWKWVIDQGADRGVKPASAPADPVAIVLVSTLPPVDAGSAWARLHALDAQLGAEQDIAALAPHYAPDVRLLGWKDAPLSGPGAVAAARAARPGVTTRNEGGGVSAAGDLGWTCGVASWTESGRAKSGPYLRVWQRRPRGWTILVENVSPF